MGFNEQLRKHLSPNDLERLQAFFTNLAPERRDAMMRFLAERETAAPAVGTDAPEFDLPQLGTSTRVRLSAFRGTNPVALIFGSFT